MTSAVSTLAACASLGGKDAPLQIPEVTDPAPFVSGTMRPYQIRGRWYHPKEQPGYDETGIASWYGAYHHGRPTSTGERFDMNALTAAHKTLPLPSLVEVTNTSNGRRVVLRVNDRGPFVDSRIIDLSKGAAEELGLMSKGLGEVRVRYLGRAPRTGGGMALQTASSAPAPRAAPATPPSTPVPYNEVVRAEVRTPATVLAPSAPLTVATAPVAAPPTWQSAPVTSPLTGPAGHWVQAAAYASHADASRFATRLGDRAQVQSYAVDGQTFYRIIVGPWPDANAAERARQAVIARGYREALLISGG
ncbi:septal ring lytic transglycosylase RlpA family protein [Brevundimonas vesicularis]|uniref:septal ring lytic transglycosylase RlpA family protein n=1 Tax=Brevundimonas vesicularis TaxID=41276 RepID=UPI0038D3F520